MNITSAVAARNTPLSSSSSSLFAPVHRQLKPPLHLLVHREVSSSSSSSSWSAAPATLLLARLFFLGATRLERSHKMRILIRAAGPNRV